MLQRSRLLGVRAGAMGRGMNRAEQDCAAALVRATPIRRAFPHDPAMRGYVVAYRPEGPNLCPGCGRSHWLVGRLSAECAFCATALEIPHSTRGGGTFRCSKPAPLDGRN